LLSGFSYTQITQAQDISIESRVIDLNTLEFEPKKLDLPIVKSEPAQKASSLPSKSPIAIVYATGGTDQWRNLVSQYSWPVEQALAVMKCESGGRADARGDGHLTYTLNGVEYGASYGLMQIRSLPGRPSPSKLVDPQFNLDYAYGMWKSQGWRPWTCARNLGIR